MNGWKTSRHLEYETECYQDTAAKFHLTVVTLVYSTDLASTAQVTDIHLESTAAAACGDTSFQSVQSSHVFMAFQKHGIPLLGFQLHTPSGPMMVIGIGLYTHGLEMPSEKEQQPDSKQWRNAPFRVRC